VTYEELIFAFNKVCKVIRSCRTFAQLQGSRTFAELYLKQVPASMTSDVIAKINKILDRQKEIIKFLKLK
jgi:hypothetical protein